MQARHFMAAVAAALFALSGCSADADVASPTSSSAVTTTTTTTTPSRPAGLHAEWSAKFETVTKPSGDGPPKCTEARPKSETCVQHLTEIVTLVLDLRKAIEARPDVAAYSETLAQIKKVTDASAEYAKCTAECYGDALAIGLSPVNLMLRLQLDDPAA